MDVADLEAVLTLESSSAPSERYAVVSEHARQAGPDQGRWGPRATTQYAVYP